MNLLCADIIRGVMHSQGRIQRVSISLLIKSVQRFGIASAGKLVQVIFDPAGGLNPCFYLVDETEAVMECGDCGDFAKGGNLP